jgi:hypothetical protein
MLFAVTWCSQNKKELTEQLDTMSNKHLKMRQERLEKEAIEAARKAAEEAAARAAAEKAQVREAGCVQWRWWSQVQWWGAEHPGSTRGAGDHLSVHLHEKIP